MNRNVWKQPVTAVQKFVPNEYVAACGDTEYGKYLFECNAPGGTLYYYDKWGRADKLGFYTPCKRKHEADKKSEFPDGFVDYNRNGKKDSGEAVIVWIERGPWGGIWNAHATTNLDRDSWETLNS